METDIIKQYILQEDNIVRFDKETYLVNPLFSTKSIKSYLSIANKGVANCYIYLRLYSDTVPTNKDLVMKSTAPDFEVRAKMERVPSFSQQIGKYVSRFRIKETVENVYSIIHSKSISLSWGQDTIKVKTSIDDFILTGFFIQTRGLSCIPESQKDAVNATEKKAKQLQEEARIKRVESERQIAEKKAEEERKKAEEERKKAEEEREKAEEEREKAEEIQFIKDVKDLVKALWSDMNKPLETRRTDLYYIHQIYKTVKNYYLEYTGKPSIVLKKLGLNQEYIVKQLELLKQRGLIDYELGIVIRVMPPNFYKNCSLQQLYDVIDQTTSVNAIKTTTKATPSTNGGCYIATCIYGSYDCPEVWTLRRFRDQNLDTRWYGRLFIQAYYAISPSLVRLFGRNHWFQSFWRHNLDIFVGKLRDRGYENTPYQDKY